MSKFLIAVLVTDSLSLILEPTDVARITINYLKLILSSVYQDVTSLILCLPTCSSASAFTSVAEWEHLKVIGDISLMAKFYCCNPINIINLI